MTLEVRNNPLFWKVTRFFVKPSRGSPSSSSSKRRISCAALRGMMALISLGRSVPALWVRSLSATASRCPSVPTSRRVTFFSEDCSVMRRPLRIYRASLSPTAKRVLRMRDANPLPGMATRPSRSIVGSAGNSDAAIPTILNWLRPAWICTQLFSCVVRVISPSATSFNSS